MTTQITTLTNIFITILIALFMNNGPSDNPKKIDENVLGTELQSCCTDPMTGFYRTGKCETDWQDRGAHVVCSEMTEAFLTYTKAKGNDLSTPRLEYGFPGLKPGDKWCLCALRWKEAMQAGVAPLVHMESTHAAALKYVSLEDLQRHDVNIVGKN